MDKIKQLREIIQREKIYVWMLIFIIWFNALNIISHSLSTKGFIKSKSQAKTEEVSPAYQRLSEMKQKDFKSILEKDVNLASLVGFAGMAVFIIIMLGIILDLKFLFLKLQGKNILPSLAMPVKANWPILDVGKIIILFLFSGYLVSLSESIIFNFFTHKKIDKNLFMIVNTGIMDILVLIFIFYFITKKYKQDLSSIGLSLKNFLNKFFLGLNSYISLIPVILMVLFIIIWLSNIFNYQPPAQPIFELFFQEKRSLLVIYLTFFATIVGPIAEEVFFRGFAYRALRERLGVFKTIALTSLVFAALHTNLAGFFPILILGIMLAYLAEKTNSIIPSITVHILHNSAILSFLFLTKKIMGIM